jgi:hypothetical protein
MKRCCGVEVVMPRPCREATASADAGGVTGHSAGDDTIAGMHDPDHAGTYAESICWSRILWERNEQAARTEPALDKMRLRSSAVSNEVR